MLNKYNLIILGAVIYTLLLLLAIAGYYMGIFLITIFIGYVVWGVGKEISKRVSERC